MGVTIAKTRKVLLPSVYWVWGVEARTCKNECKERSILMKTRCKTYQLKIRKESLQERRESMATPVAKPLHFISGGKEVIHSQRKRNSAANTTVEAVLPFYKGSRADSPNPLSRVTLVHILHKTEEKAKVNHYRKYEQQSKFTCPKYRFPILKISPWSKNGPEFRPVCSNLMDGH